MTPNSASGPPSARLLTVIVPGAISLLRSVRLRARRTSSVSRAITASAPSSWAERSAGAYLLRTNCTETDPAKIWRWYIQLTQAEAAFRTSKSDIGLRSIYHQKSERVESHLLVCFLSLAMWRSLEMWMQSKGLGTSARKLVEAVSTIRSMDVVVPVKRAEHTIDLRLRTVAKPDQDVAVFLAHLGLTLPKRKHLPTCVPFTPACAKSSQRPISSCKVMAKRYNGGLMPLSSWTLLNLKRPFLPPTPSLTGKRPFPTITAPSFPAGTRNG